MSDVMEKIEAEIARAVDKLGWTRDPERMDGRIDGLRMALAICRATPHQLPHAGCDNPAKCSRTGVCDGLPDVCSGRRPRPVYTPPPMPPGQIADMKADVANAKAAQWDMARMIQRIMEGPTPEQQSDIDATIERAEAERNTLIRKSFMERSGWR
jgi:hypothetical protein